MSVPSGKEICNRQLFNLVERVEKVEINEEQINELLPEIYKKLEWLSREELIKHFVSVEFNRFLSYYKNAPDLNADIKASDEKGKVVRKSQRGFTRFFINIGNKNNLNPGKLIELINEKTNTNDIEIGKIDIMKKFSFFEIDKDHDKKVMNALNDNVEFEGVNLIVDRSKPEPVGARFKERSKERSGSKPRSRSRDSFGKGRRSDDRGKDKGRPKRYDR